MTDSWLSMMMQEARGNRCHELPLKSLKKGACTLQIHVRDTIADTHIYRRVPGVMQ